MKRVLNGVHVLMAVGLIVALAACSGGSDNGLKQERDQALAAAEAADAAKVAAEEAAAQAALDQKAAEDAAAQAALDQKAAEDALAVAEAEKLALEEELAGATPSIPELEAELAAANAAHTEAAAAKAAADVALEVAMDMRMAAQTAVNDSAPEGLAEAIVALQAAREAESAAEAEAMTAAEVATAAYADVATAKAALAAADTGPSSETLASQNTVNARKAFVKLAGLTTIKAADETLSAKHSGTAVTFSSSNKVSPFTTAEANMAPAIDGWASATLKGKRSAGNATVMAYSNIEAPKDELFAVHYDVTAEPIAETADWKKVRIAPANTYSSGVTTGGTVMGTYDGAAGTFTCSEACPSREDGLPERRSNGSVIGDDIPGTWTFKVADKAATVKVADSDYLAFGYWLVKSSTGEPLDFSVFYGGGGSKTAVAELTEIMLLDEEVTYTGAAAGKYVTKDDIANTAQPGYFTATAELKADFRADALTGLDSGEGVGTLKGSISGFKDGETAPLGNLKLSLSGVLRHDATAGDACSRRFACSHRHVR